MVVLKCICKVSPEPFLLQAEQHQLPQPVFTGDEFQSSNHFCVDFVIPQIAVSFHGYVL